MSRVIFDIETLGVDFEGLDVKSQEYLVKFAESEEEVEEMKQKMALWGVVAEVIVIGLLNPDTGKGVVYYRINSRISTNQNTNDINHESERELGHGNVEGGTGDAQVATGVSASLRGERGDARYVEVGSERELLERFWEDVKKFDQFITFNGRGFDCPFLILRSGILGVKVTKNLMPYRYNAEVHVDLLEQFTFYGATRKFSLDFYCKRFGIKSPKEKMTGLEVPEYWKEGRGREVAEYCFGDLLATGELWRRWRDFMLVC